MHPNNGYFQMPTISEDHLVFVCDDDLWRIERNDLHTSPTRLTTSQGFVSRPRISPDGKTLAYLSNESGQFNVYTLSIAGGAWKQITFQGAIDICGWKDQKHLIYTSAKDFFHPRCGELYEINTETLEETKLPYGLASTLQYGPTLLLGRNNGDPARWKRYRGGTAGHFWLKDLKSKKFKHILKNLQSNLTNPLWVGQRLYFISDHEGIGNIYSCAQSGGKLTKHTSQKEFYIRNFSFDGKDTLAYQVAGDLYTLSLGKSSTETKLNISIESTFRQSQKRFESTNKNLQDYALSPQSDMIALISRGQLFIMPPWRDGPIPLRDQQTVRMKKCTWLTEDKILLLGINQQNEECFRLYSLKTNSWRSLSQPKDIGKVMEMKASPHGGYFAFSNNRNQLFLHHIGQKRTYLIDQSPHQNILDLTWSPDSKYLAYVFPYECDKRGIKVLNAQNRKSQELISPILQDFSPSFDPSGRYLYFLSIREFRPTYSETHFDVSFPFATRPYVVILDQQACHPFSNFDSVDYTADDSDPKKTVRCHIDFDDINQRIYPIGHALGGYESLIATRDRLFYTKEKIAPLDPNGPDRYSTSKLHLYKFSLKSKKEEHFAKNVNDIDVCATRKYALIDQDDDLRIVNLEQKPSEGEGYNPKDGWIDIDKIRFQIDPKSEWHQMYNEAWTLQKEHFWTEDMSSIPWEDIYFKYYPLLDKVHTRSEMSDLLWEMQGELGTSHCYEYGGDYLRSVTPMPCGSLGAELEYQSHKKSLLIKDIYQGDSWIQAGGSPLYQPGVGLKKGDEILTVNEVPVEEAPLHEILFGQAGQKVSLEVRRKGERTRERVFTSPLPSASLLNYRQWVNKNKNYVHEKTKGKIGYVHIPNMMVQGFSEFYRHYLTEHKKDGIIIDVRFNGGGHVSQLILKMLAQQHIGYDVTRWFGLEKYPMYAPNGPLVCLTNEKAGSDGDIFSHSFKLMGLGKLIGKRTWGGVIGIWPRHDLNDGTVTSQPEFSHWFKDVGYDVENYGTDPDIEVDITPEDYQRGSDSQLDRSIEEVQKALKRYKSLNVLKTPRPNLSF